MGSASATARAAGAEWSHAIAALLNATGSSVANSSGHSRIGRPDSKIKASTIFSERLSCALTGTSERSFSRAAWAKYTGIFVVATRPSFCSLRTPKRFAAASNACNRRCALDTLRTASAAALFSRSDEIGTFGRTITSVSTAIAVTRDPISPATAAHLSIAATAAASGSPTSGSRISLIGIATLQSWHHDRYRYGAGVDLHQTALPIHGCRHAF